MIQKKGGIFIDNIIVSKLYLDEIKEKIKNDKFYIIKRDINDTFIRKYRLQKDKIKSILLEITHEDFISSGDERDNKFDEGIILIYNKKKTLMNYHGALENVNIYIKIKYNNNDSIVPIISFHLSYGGKNVLS